MSGRGDLLDEVQDHRVQRTTRDFDVLQPDWLAGLRDLWSDLDRAGWHRGVPFDRQGGHDSQGGEGKHDDVSPEELRRDANTDPGLFN